MADATQAISSVAQLLESLHPLREPPPPASALPYLAMLALGIAAAAAAMILLRLLRRRSLRAAAGAMLVRSRALGAPERLVAQAELLRRLVRATRGERDARAQGSAWLAALDQTFATRFFSEGEGRLYADALYRRVPAADVDALDRALTGLIVRLRFNKPRFGGAPAGPAAR